MSSCCELLRVISKLFGFHDNICKWERNAKAMIWYWYVSDLLVDLVLVLWSLPFLMLCESEESHEGVLYCWEMLRVLSAVESICKPLEWCLKASIFFSKWCIAKELWISIPTVLDQSVKRQSVQSVQVKLLLCYTTGLHLIIEYWAVACWWELLWWAAIVFA